MNKRQMRFALKRLTDARNAATMRDASFGNISTEGPFPKRENQVSAFIIERTRLYRHSWIIPQIDQVIDLLERQLNLK